MIDKSTARRLGIAAALIFLSTVALLLGRQFSLGPIRPAPDWRTFGPAEAPVQIQEFTDFACPACRMAAGKIDEMMRVFGPGLRVSFKHYPLLNIHPWSLDAAAYADCAGEQGKFKAYADLLFEGQEKWGLAKAPPPEFADYAKRLKLDWAAMQVCARSEATQKRLRTDIAEGDLRGVTATPTFFINGRRAVGAAQLIDQAMKFDNILREAAKK
jgi:protein-disulfide isomerase